MRRHDAAHRDLARESCRDLILNAAWRARTVVNASTADVPVIRNLARSGLVDVDGPRCRDIPRCGAQLGSIRQPAWRRHMGPARALRPGWSLSCEKKYSVQCMPCRAMN